MLLRCNLRRAQFNNYLDGLIHSSLDCELVPTLSGHIVSGEQQVQRI